MKNILLALIIIVTLQGCWECQVQYKDAINGNLYGLNADSLTVSCNLISTDHKRISIRLTFDGKMQKQHINNISITVLTDDKKQLSLAQVEMTPSKYVNWPTVTEPHTKRNFSDLQDDFKFTTMDGKGILYFFEFTSPQNIRSKMLNISILVELQNGKVIRFKHDFLREKYCYFGVH